VDPTADLIVHEWIFPEPGTDESFAVIRHLRVQRNGVEVMVYRAVTWAEPRRLIQDGYFRTLEDAAAACHRSALHRLVKPQLNSTAVRAWG
jgi:hypothetical protein